MLGRRFITSLCPLLDRSLLLFLYRLGRDFLEPQGLISIGHPQGAVDIFMDHHFGGPCPVLNLVELLIVGYRKVIPKPPLCLYS